jgi:regulatory protein
VRVSRAHPPADPQAILRAAEAAARDKVAASAVQRAGRREGTVAAVGSEVPEDVRKAVAFILRSTGQRPQTEAEIRKKLLGREYDDRTTDEAIAHARTLKALDDAALARSWVEERGIGKGFGVARLRRELQRRLVPDDVIEDALSRLDSRDDLTAALELARKRVRQLPASLEPEAVVRRLTSYLVRRGHPPGLAQRVAIDVSGINREWD